MWRSIIGQHSVDSRKIVDRSMYRSRRMSVCMVLVKLPMALKKKIAKITEILNDLLKNTTGEFGFDLTAREKNPFSVLTELFNSLTHTDSWKYAFFDIFCSAKSPNYSKCETWDELKVRQNLLASDYEIYILCLFVATVYWHKSRQFVKKSSIILLPHLFTILWAVSMIKLCSTTF